MLGLCISGGGLSGDCSEYAFYVLGVFCGCGEEAFCTWVVCGGSRAESFYACVCVCVGIVYG